MADRLVNSHRSALLILMAVSREVSNPELQEIAGFTITGELRSKLNKEGYVLSRKVGRSFVHELTEKGWVQCAAELSADAPDRAGRYGKALYLILGGLDRFLQRKKLRLADVFHPVEEPSATPLGPGLADQIRMAYGKLAVKARDWVPLVELRPLLNGATKRDVDDELLAMSRAGQVHLAPDSNRKTLTEEDHASAIRVGGEDVHLLAIEES